MPPPARPAQAAGSRNVAVKDERLESPEAELTDDDDPDLLDLDNLQAEDPDSPGGSHSKDGQGNSAAPLQKRRRVTRACDECRRKKIKCDGKQPCTHCQVYSYDCTYDKPSNRRRNPAPQYIEALESKLQRAETLLRKYAPDVDLNDPNLDPAVQQEFRIRERARATQAVVHKKDEGEPSPGQDARLRSMIESIGQLELDDRGDYNFHGISSGAVFFKRMKDHFSSLLGPDYTMPRMPRPPRPIGVLTLDSPRSPSQSPLEAAYPGIYSLPSIDTARRLCKESLETGTCLMRIVHLPSFWEMFERLYSTPPESFTKEDNRGLSLLYSVLALGCMFDVPEDGGVGSPAYEMATEEGLKYYTSARLLLQDITECRDLMSLQAFLFMILFIQAISNLSTCYGYVGIAVRSALRMGLHRHLPHARHNTIETEVRKRVFWVCRMMDVYVSALLGFPLLLQNEDIDQPYPTAVDDEYITMDGIITPPQGTPSFFQAFNAYCKLMDILADIVKHIYPLKGIDNSVTEGGQPVTKYMISYSKIQEIERALQKWYEELPAAWRPSPQGSEEVVRVRNLLRFAYAHVQLLVYRPFLQYISPKYAQGKGLDDRAYACGAAGVSVARNIVHVGIELRKQRELIGSYWFTFYTEFLAIMTLVYFVLENQDKPGAAEVLEDAKAGKETISALSRRSMAAERISSTLNTLFENIPDKLKKPKARPIPTKKRSAPGPRGENPIRLTSRSSQASTSTRSSEESVRVGSATIPRRPAEVVRHSVSFDVAMQNRDFSQEGYSPRFQEPSPMDVAPGPQDFAIMQEHGQNMSRASSGVNQVSRVDAMMFPSGDPLAYPNMPRTDFQRQGSQSSIHRPSTQPHENMQFYIPNTFDTIEGQLMGPIPSYLMQSPGQAGYEFPPQMYPGSGSMIPQHQQPMPGQDRQQRHPLQQQQQQQQQQQHQQAQQRDIDELFAGSQWGGMFPPHG